MPYTVYIIKNPQGKLYKGHTSDLEKRLQRHNSGRSKYTSNKGPWKLVYFEEHPTKSAAVKRELQLKKWSRDLLDNLINQVGNEK